MSTLFAFPKRFSIGISAALRFAIRYSPAEASAKAGFAIRRVSGGSQAHIRD